MNKRVAWTDESVAQARQMRADGATFAEIGRQLGGRSPGAVDSALRRYRTGKACRGRPPELGRQRRHAVCEFFKNREFLSIRRRKGFAEKYQVLESQILSDVRDLRNAGCLVLLGAPQRHNTYRWVRDYDPASPKKSAAAPGGTKKRNCLCCGAEFPSAGIGNRLCTMCRNSADGVTVYRVVR